MLRERPRLQRSLRMKLQTCGKKQQTDVRELLEECLAEA